MVKQFSALARVAIFAVIATATASQLACVFSAIKRVCAPIRRDRGGRSRHHLLSTAFFSPYLDDNGIGRPIGRILTVGIFVPFNAIRVEERTTGAVVSNRII